MIHPLAFLCACLGGGGVVELNMEYHMVDKESFLTWGGGEGGAGQSTDLY